MSRMHAQSNSGKAIGVLTIAAVMLIFLRLAGANFSSEHDQMFGGLSVEDSNRQTDQVFAYFNYAVIFLVLVLSVPRHREILRLLFRSSNLLALLIIAMVSCFWSQDPVTSIKGSLGLAISMLFAYWAILEFNDRQKMQLLMWFGALAAFMSVFVVYFFPNKGLDSAHGYAAWQGIFYSKNHMGRVFLFLLSPAFFYKCRTNFERIAVPLYAVAVIFMIGMSQSVTAWLVTFAYLLLAAFLKISSRVSRREIYLFLCCAALVVAVASLLLFPDLNSILAIVGRDASLTNRTTIWSILLISVSKRPMFGWGYQAFWAGSSSEGMNAIIAEQGLLHFLGSYAHSGYLSVILEIGYGGLACVILLLTKALLNALVCLRAASDKSVLYWHIAVLLLTIGYNIDEVTIMLPMYLPWIMVIWSVSSLRTMVGNGIRVGPQRNMLEPDRSHVAA